MEGYALSGALQPQGAALLGQAGKARGLYATLIERSVSPLRCRRPNNHRCLNSPIGSTRLKTSYAEVVKRTCSEVAHVIKTQLAQLPKQDQSEPRATAPTTA